ncbi:MAG: hypothetical protein ABI832_24455 [bacterium]
MNLVKQIWSELVGMFVDDGALATQIAVLVAAVTGAVKLIGIPPLWAATFLIPGCVVILATSIKRARRK